MNIFATNEDPIISARELCDQHIKSKMQTEGAIMLAHAFPQDVLDYPSTPRTKKGAPRKRGGGYYNHCCSIWARETKDNFVWLVEHTLEMFNERLRRFPHYNEHFTKTFIEWCKDNIHNTIIDKQGLTPFAIAINQNSNCRKVQGFNELSTVDKYKSFIKHDKPFATWTNTQQPSWIL